MLSLSLNDISKSYGFHHVLNRVSLLLNDGDHIGLVGANGVGKSTLLKIVTGELEPDSGTVMLAPGANVGYLAQVITGFDDNTLAEMIDASLSRVRALEMRLRDLEAQMASLQGDALDAAVADYGDVTEQFERYGGYEIEARTGAVLEGLGVGHLPRDRVFGTLSGGEKSRVGLAMLLLGAPDVLLLDEPTNHLDFASLEWLEGYLSAYRGAALIVSHDREFLNRTVNAIVEIDEHTRAAKRYAGDYDAYHAAKEHERRRWRQEYENQQEELRELRLAVKETARNNSNYRPQTDNDKFMRYKKAQTHQATVSRRIAAAEEKLRRIEANPIPQPPDELRFNPRLNVDVLKGRLPLTADGLVKAFGTRRMLDSVSFDLPLDGRVVLVGPNGAGKSTLLKMLVGAETPDAGKVYINPAVKIGYLDQEGVELNASDTILESCKAEVEWTEQQVITLLLKSGLFRYDDLGKRISQLSSGQRRKVQIARLIAGGANLLALDEPTNYVSFDVLEGLEAALWGFPGPVIAASHDRRFMENFGGDIWEVRDGHILRHTGGYAAYLAGARALAVENG
jgi:macrolide transport system ATP-binding/permease protein